MTKLSELSLRLLDRLDELELLSEDTEESVEAVEDNLEDSLKSFSEAFENFLTDDFGDMTQRDDLERLGDHVCRMVVKVTSLGGDTLSLEEGLEDVLRHLPSEQGPEGGEG